MKAQPIDGSGNQSVTSLLQKSPVQEERRNSMENPLSHEEDSRTVREILVTPELLL